MHPHPHTSAAPCYPPKRRIRAPPSHCQDSSSNVPRTPSSSAPRWLCPLPFCTRSYGRPHDLVRHLDAAHHTQLCAADDALLAVLGVPVEHIARLRSLMSRRNRCAVCGETFTRADTLLRHLDEQGHRLLPAAGSSASPASSGPPSTPVTPSAFSQTAVPAARNADCVSALHETQWHSEAGALTVPPPAASLPGPRVPGHVPLTVGFQPSVAGEESRAWDPELVRVFRDWFGTSQ